MEESEILARFQEVRSEKPEVQPETTQDNLPDPEDLSLFSFFGTDDKEKNDTKYQEKLRVIKEFAKDGAKDRADMLWNLKEVRNELGAPAFGKSEFDHLYEYIKLKTQLKSLKKEIEAFK